MQTKSLKTLDLKKQFGTHFNTKFKNNEFSIVEVLGRKDSLNEWEHEHATLEDAVSYLEKKNKNILSSNIKNFDDTYSGVTFKILIGLAKLGFFKGKQIHKIIKDNELSKELINEKYEPPIVMIDDSTYITVPSGYPKEGTQYFYADLSEYTLLEYGLNIIPIKIKFSKIYTSTSNAEMAFDFESEAGEEFYLSTDIVKTYNAEQGYYVNGNNCYIAESEAVLKEIFILKLNKIKEKYSKKLMILESLLNKN